MDDRFDWIGGTVNAAQSVAGNIGRNGFTKACAVRVSLYKASTQTRKRLAARDKKKHAGKAGLEYGYVSKKIKKQENRRT